MKPLAVILAVFLCAQAGGAIKGFEVGLNGTGMNFSPAVYTSITTTGAPGSGQWKPEYVKGFINVMKPETDRTMDYWQVVTNTTTTWANRSLSDFSPNGLTYETTINMNNQALAINPRFRPYLNSPIFANESHDEELGYLYGTRYQGKRVIFGKGNEGWDIYGNNLPAQNLFAARAEGEPGEDFQKAGRRWGKLLGKGAQAFIRGWVRAGRSASDVMVSIECFAPATSWGQYQMDGMRSIGIEPRNLNAEIAIALYAAGADTDLQGPLNTNAQKRDALMAFIASVNGPKGWTDAHMALAKANGLRPVVNAYEFRLGTYSPSAAWKDFQDSPEMLQVQNAGWALLVAASGGVDSFQNAEGFFGFPFDSGIFSLADLDQFANPFESQAFAGTYNQIDFSLFVPEPSAVAILAGGGAALCLGRRGRVAA